MTKNRKRHRKECRLNGERAKLAHRQRIAHQRNLQTFQKVLEHSEALALKHPELFASVMDLSGKLHAH